MRRVFFQSSANVPRGGAQANYIQYLALAIAKTEWQPILITGLNKEYIFSSNKFRYKGIEINPIIPSIDDSIKYRQKSTGYCEERKAALQKYYIDNDDIVITFEVGYNTIYNQMLIELKQSIGFKVIVVQLELWGREDFQDKEKYDIYRYVLDALYPKYDAVLSISSYIDKYFLRKGMRVFRLPPMIDSSEYLLNVKSKEKYKFLISTEKDSLDTMIMAFSKLKDEVLDKLELNLFNIKEETVKAILSESAIKRLSKYIIIHKWMKYDKMIELFQKMHFLVIARNVSQRTLANFPSKIPETMNYGIVPIVSEVGDYTQYYLQDGINSIFIRGDSVEEICKSIRRATEMPIEEYRFFSEEARKLARETFDYHHWVAKVDDMLRAVAN